MYYRASVLNRARVLGQGTNRASALQGKGAIRASVLIGQGYYRASVL